MKDNKGFTLVEAVVTVAIFSVVALGILIIVNSGANSYASVQNNVSLQIESQLVMSQVQQNILSCNGGLYWDDANKVLHAISLVEDTDNNGIYETKSLKSFYLNTADRELFYDTLDDNNSNLENHLTSISGNLATVDDLMSEGVEDLDITFDIDANGNVRSVTMDFTFRKRTQEFTVRQIIATRNTPALIPDAVSLQTFFDTLDN